MSVETWIPIILSVISLLGVALTARNGMVSASDDMASGFSSLNKELRSEMDRRDARNKKIIDELRTTYTEDIEALRIRISNLEKTNDFLRREMNRESARSQYFRNGAWQLYHQYKELLAYGKTSDEPLFNPAIDKFPPTPPNKGNE